MKNVYEIKGKGFIVGDYPACNSDKWLMIDATAFNDTSIKKTLVYGEVAVYLGSVKEVIGRHKRQMHEIRRYTKAIWRRS